MPPSRISSPERNHCELVEESRHRLTLADGRRVHVEPVAFVPNAAGDHLLAGTYNYVFERDSAGAWRFARADSVFGVVWPRTGSPVLLPSPVPHLFIVSTRAAAREDGAWDVVFAEVASRADESFPDSAVRLWHGVVDRDGWRHVDTIPITRPVGTIRPVGASRLVRYGDTLSWALVAGPVPLGTAIVLDHVDGRWTVEAVPGSMPAYLDLAHSETTGLLLAAVHPDRELRRDGNSLFLRERRRGWTGRKLVPSSWSEVHAPAITLGETASVHWLAGVERGQKLGTELHALLGVLDDSLPSPIVLDSLPLAAAAHLALDGAREGLWAFRGGAEGWSAEIRFVRLTDGVANVFASFPYPFAADMAVAADGHQTVSISGGMIEEDAAVSLMVRLRAICERR